MEKNNIIDDFINEFIGNLHSYETIKEVVFKKTKTELDNAGIMAITSSRVKNPVRLKEKLISRNRENTYTSFDDIYQDIPDFIGIRIALYFPSDLDKVDAIINKLFKVQKIKSFPNEQKNSSDYERTFPGYKATHYRIALDNNQINIKTIEIQVASLLMHAWSEVEHDLVYKRKSGDVSFDEHEALDEINGLVLTGELALQRLKRVFELRKENENRTFENHFQLASYMYDRISSIHGIKNPNLGDVQSLFLLLKHKNRLTIKKVNNDLKNIDPNSDIPFSTQILEKYIDSAEIMNLVAENNYIKNSSNTSLQIPSTNLVQVFFKKWTKLEKTIKKFVNQTNIYNNKYVNTYNQIENSGLFDLNFIENFKSIMKIRNEMVHEGIFPEEEKMCECIKIMDSLQKDMDELTQKFEPAGAY